MLVIVLTMSDTVDKTNMAGYARTVLEAAGCVRASVYVEFENDLVTRTMTMTAQCRELR